MANASTGIRDAANLPDHERALSALRSFSRAAAAAVIVVAAMVLASWTSGEDFFTRLVTGAVPMNPLTAAGFVVTGFALLGLHAHAPLLHRVARGAGVCLFAMGAVRLVHYAAGVGNSIDTCLFAGQLFDRDTGAVVRMAPNTAANFVIFGAALAIPLGRPRGLAVREILCLLMFLHSLLALTDYIFGAGALYQARVFSPMALHTSYCFTFSALALLCLEPRAGILRVLTRDASGGDAARRLLPIAVLVPILIGWLRLVGQNRGWYDASFGRALYAVIMIAVLCACTWLLAARLNAADERRQMAVEDLDRFFTMSHDLLCVASMDGYFKRLSPAFSRMLGWSNEDLLAHPFMYFVHPDDVQATIDEVKRQADGESVMLFANRYRCKDGRYVVLEWSSMPHGDRMYAVARDVTEQRQSESRILELIDLLEERASQLDTANKELESFSYSVSHDLRAPLRHISGFVDLLKKRLGSAADEKARHFIEVISRSTQQMGALIDDLLSFSRMGRSELRHDEVPLDTLARDVVRELQTETEGRDIEWNIGALPTASADLAMLRQVFVNLLGNAVKYTRTKEKAVIDVGATRENGEIVIYVRDNGVGFDMKYMDKLFGVFQRLHRADEFEGTGIGLANVRRIIARHGGRTWAEAAVDRGATIYFSLPAEPKKNVR